MVRILATLLAPDPGKAWAGGLDAAYHAAAVRRVAGLSGQYAASTRTWPAGRTW